MHDNELAVAMIVKNEAAHLPRCLDSLRPLQGLVTQVCIYDTGSTDNTVEIARASGAHVELGYWDGDFSRARNAGLQFLSAPWAVILDADEEFVCDEAALRLLLATTTADVINAQVIHLDDAGNEISRSWCGKIIRHPRTAYRGRVHEVAERVDGTPTVTVEVDASVLSFPHYGYRNAEVRQGKARRNAQSSQGEVTRARRSGDTERLAQALYHQGRSLLLLGDAQPGRAALRESYDLFVDGSVGKDRAAFALVGALLSAGDNRAAMSLVQDHQTTGAPADVMRLLLARVSLAAENYSAVMTLTAAISPHGDPVRDVEPRAVLTVRLAAARLLNAHDEALACALTLYLEHEDTGQLADILQRTRHESAATVAALLSHPGRETTLVGDLRTHGERGAAIADALGQYREHTLAPSHR